MADRPESVRIGEVVEATPTTFVAQCYQLYGAPPLGSLARTGDPAIQGVVYHVVTEPLDANRPVLARGESAVTEDEVFRANPQLERLLTSRFEVLILGHRARGVDFPVLPPLPPRVHAFVYACSAEETVRLARDPRLADDLALLECTRRRSGGGCMPAGRSRICARAGEVPAPCLPGNRR